MIGHNVSHAKNRTRKIFKPNLHNARITIAGRTHRVRLCTKCLRMLKGSKKPNKTSQTEIAQNPQVAAVV